MESHTYFVSSRGLLKSCDLHNIFPASSNTHIDPSLLEKYSDGFSIYVCTDAIPNFINNFLPKIKGNFTLVTGDSDTTVDANLLNSKLIFNLISDPRLKTWHAQNLMVEHEKIFQIPIGLDYHSMIENPGSWGLNKISPIAQERTLTEIFERSLSLEKRIFAGYCNWQFALDRGDRRECLTKMKPEVCLLEKYPLPRTSSWLRQAECIFVISPEGAGADCHRTWEALVLGCIPIVKKSIFTRIFEDLPVIIVEDWYEVNTESLLNSLNNLIIKKFNYQKLFTSYWVKLINNKPITSLSKMTINEFRQYICTKSN